jgi:hypothetical protein
MLILLLFNKVSLLYGRVGAGAGAGAASNFYPEPDPRQNFTPSPIKMMRLRNTGFNACRDHCKKSLSTQKTMS